MKLKTINMRALFILLLGLITFQVSAQKIIGSTTTAGGDLEGTYPNPHIKQNIINSANLTSTLRDSLTFRTKDTIVYRTSNYDFDGQYSNVIWARYKTVFVMFKNKNGAANLYDLRIPWATDTLLGTTFVIIPIIDVIDSIQVGTSLIGNILQANTGTSLYATRLIKSSKDGQLFPIIKMHCVKPDAVSDYSWAMELDFDLQKIEAIVQNTGITTLTGDVLASGTGSVAATIAPDAVTSAKILNGTIVSADIASQTIDSVDIKNSSITTVKLETGAVTSVKVLDNSLTGSDLTYLTLRAGTTSNASLQLTSGADKTTLTGGEILYNGRFAVGIGSSKRRIATVNDANTTNGYLPIGNGTDFTIAPITAGTGITVTNGSGSITVGETVAKVTSVNMLDADVDIVDEVNATLITHVNAYFTNGLYTITAPSPSSGLVGRMIIVNCSATTIGYGYLIETASVSSEFWGVNPVSNPTNYIPAAFSSDGWNTTLYTTITYTCRQINGTYYWVRDHFFDPFLGQNWYDYKTSVTGTTLTFDTYVPDGAYVQEKLRLYKNGLFMNLGVDYTVTDNYPFVVVNLVSAAVSGDKWYFTYQY